jgi:two-component system NtrC family sensor kinase
MSRFLSIFLLFFAGFTATIPVRAEDAPENPDSMLKVLSHLPDDTNKLILYDAIVESISDDVVWPAYNDKMGTLAARLAQDKNPAIQRTAKRYLAACLNNKAVMKFYKSDVASAIELHLQGLKIREEVGDKTGITESLNNIGYALHQQGELEKAISFYRRALVIEQQTGDEKGKGLTLNNIGLTCYTQGKYREALGYYRMSLAIRQKMDDKQSTAATLNNMGTSFGKLNDFENSIRSFEESYKISEEIQNKRGMALSLTEIGNALVKQGNLKKALEVGLKAHSLALEVGFPVRIRATSQLLKNIYKAQGDYSKAFAMFELETQMRDTLQNEETKKTTLRQQFQYEFEKKEASLKAEQEKKDVIVQQQIQKQKILRNALFAVVGLMLILVLVLVNRYYSRQKTNGRLAAAYDSLKKTQQQLIQKEKLASLGQLTASIAHEIKNPLNFVNNFSELSRELVEEMKLEKTDEEKAEILSELEMNLSRIALHGRRADSIVKGMLHHSRTDGGEKHDSDLNAICDEAMNLAFHSIRSRIPDFNCVIDKIFDPQLPHIRIVQQDISRVLLNLLNNAFYAVRAKGIEISHQDQENETKSQPYSPRVSIITYRDGNNAVIRVTDNGNGIPEKIRSKIFDPFFTTKPSGEGTGLGLSISYDIIKAHQGEMKAESGDGEFTEFVISLPLGHMPAVASFEMHG